MGFDILFEWLIDKVEELYPFSILSPDEAGVHIVTIPFAGKFSRWFKSIPKNGQWVESVGPGGTVCRLPFMSEIRTTNIRRSYEDTDDIPIRTKDGRSMLLSLALKLRVTNPRKALIETEDYEMSLVTDAHNIVAQWAEEHDTQDVKIAALIQACHEPIRTACLRWGCTVEEIGVNSLAEQDVHFVRGIEL
jgi:hypothetical protein